MADLEVKTSEIVPGIAVPITEKRGRNLILFYWAIAGICGLAAGMRLLGLDRLVFEGAVPLRHFDKAGHLMLFGLLSFSFHFLARKHTPWELSNIVTRCLSLVFLLALLDEYSQLWFADRSFEALDLLANVVGAGLFGPWGCFCNRSEIYRIANRSGRIGSVFRRFQSRRRAQSRILSRRACYAQHGLPNCELKSARTIRLLLVEDDPWFVARTARTVEQLNQSLESGRLSLEVEGTLAGAVHRLDGGEFDLVLADISLPDGQGKRVYNVLRQVARKVPVVVVTNAGSWGAILGIDPIQQANTFSKRQLNPESLFWLVHHSIVGAVGIVGTGRFREKEPLGFSESFGRIRFVNSTLS